MSDYPWFDSRCDVLRFQLRFAKLLSPRSTEVRLLLRRYQGQLKRSKVAGNHRDIVSLSQLLKTNLDLSSPILAPGQLATHRYCGTMLPPEL